MNLFGDTGKVLAVAGVMLVASLFTAHAIAADNIHRLRFELAETDSAAGKLQIVARMDRLMDGGEIRPDATYILVSGLIVEPVFAHAQVQAFLQKLLNSNRHGAEATRSLANRLSHHRPPDPATARILMQVLDGYQQQRALSGATLARLGDAIRPWVDSAIRNFAWSALDRSGALTSASEELLNDMIAVFESDLPDSERQRAWKVVLAGAERTAAPRQVRRLMYQVATQHPDAHKRLAAWPTVIEQAADDKRRYSLQVTVAGQLMPSSSASAVSFDGEPAEVTEQAVGLLLQLAPSPPRAYFVDTLIDLVERYESPAAMEEIVRLRRLNIVTEAQQDRLRELRMTNPEIAEQLALVTVPNLEPGALVSPLAIASESASAEERVRATQVLQAELAANQTVPREVADVAYEVMQSGQFDEAATALVLGADDSFADKEAKLLALAGEVRPPSGRIIAALSELHQGADIEFLLRRYLQAPGLAPGFRRELVSQLYRTQRETESKLQESTVQALLAYAETESSYYGVQLLQRVLQQNGTETPLALRLKDKGFRWSMLGLVLLASWLIGAVASLIWVVTLLLPKAQTGLSGGARIGGLVGWLFLAAGFVAVNGLAILFSLGHNSTPNPGPAAPFYLMSLALSILAAGVAFGLLRRGSRAAPTVESAAA